MNDISELLMVTGKIAGISGLTIGVFFLLFKDVIQKNIFSKLGKDNSYKIIRLFLILVWSVAFSGLLVWLVLSLMNNKTIEVKTDNSVIKTVNADATVITGNNPNMVQNNKGTIHFYNNENKIEPSWSFSISALTDSQRCDPKDKSLFSPDACISDEYLDYFIYKNKGVLGIYPNMKKIKMTSYGSLYEFKFRFPKLDLKVVNNTEKTLFIDEVILDEINSSKDKNQFLLATTACQNASISMIDINRNSSIPLIKPKFEFNITRQNKDITEKKYSYTLDLDKYKSEYGYEINLSKYLNDIGINFDEISKLNKAYEYALSDYLHELYNCKDRDNCKNLKSQEKKAKIHLNEYKKLGLKFNEKVVLNNNEVFTKYDLERPTIDGNLIYERYNYKDKQVKVMKFHFSDGIFLTVPWECGSAMDPTEEYTTKLRTEGSNYNINIPVSQFIKKEEVDRFLIKLGVEKASFHSFKVKLRTTNGKELISQPIEIYIPNF